MITLHHLHRSRSFRVVWLMEELGLPYDLVLHGRRPDFSGDDALHDVHALHRSPVVIDGKTVLFESGAILEYLIHRYGQGSLAVPPHHMEYAHYLVWMHAAEGTCMAALMPIVTHRLLGESAPSDRQVAASEGVLRLVDNTLAERDYFGGAAFSAADIMMETYVLLASRFMEQVYAASAHLPRFIDRVHARPGYHRALEVIEPQDEPG